MKKLLLHTCCAPCLIAPYRHLKDDFHITIFWYNHNIHPTTEYFTRRNALRTFIQQNNIPYIEHDEYGLLRFLKETQNAENRCLQCYSTRMHITAYIAKTNGFDCFSTTLLYSIYQKHELLKQICSNEQFPSSGGVAIKQTGCSSSDFFYYYDFREYFQEGVKLAKASELYRQKYCGCIFSEMERYAPKQNPPQAI